MAFNGPEDRFSDVGAWPVEQRLRLVEDVWGGLCAASDLADGHEELKTLLDHRIESLDRNPDAIIPWEAVEARALSRFRQ
jgi:putative addiction module component (TIGR02574 family)